MVIMNLHFIYLIVVIQSVFADEERIYSHKVSKRSLNVADKIKGKVLKIATLEAAPYMMITRRNEKEMNCTGYIADLIFEISKRLNFNYTFYSVDRYGSYNEETKQWNGLIGEVLKPDGADIGAADLTITHQRELVINFVKPFLHLGIVPVIKKPNPQESYETIGALNYIGIFFPFTPAVWLFILLAYVVVSMFLWVMNLFNPYEWRERYNIGLADKSQAEAFDVAGAFWYTFSTFQWQGFERAPRSLAARLMSGVWFVFVTVILAVYTAGIIYHLFWLNAIRDKIPTWLPFRDLPHLLVYQEYNYGTVLNSRTHNYLTQVARGEEFNIIRQRWNTSEGKQNLVPSFEQGLEKVRNGKYALFMDSMRAKWLTNKLPCDLVTIGEPVGQDSFGLALPIHSPILEEMHTAVLQLIEEGVVEDLEQKWFVGDDECWNEKTVDRVAGDLTAYHLEEPIIIGLDILWGNFLLLVLGVLMGIAVGVGEMFYFKRWGRYNSSNQPQSQQLKLDSDDVVLN